MKSISILWTDDEIDLLRPHILFLESKGYTVTTASNGDDAIKLVNSQSFDLVFLDENMPGLSGLETLSNIKSINPNLPVVMVTKSEEENIMDEAIGGKIEDYLIKPVNPNQVLLSIKKALDNKRLVTEKTTSAYQMKFSEFSKKIMMASEMEDWVDLYKELTYWDLELENSTDSGMKDVLNMQKQEANNEFTRFIKINYLSWFKSETKNKPLLSPSVFKNTVFPLLAPKQSVVVILIDNLRLDQWRVITPLLLEYYTLQSDNVYCSILPTATQYSRNALFAGLMPFEIQQLSPECWLEEDDEGSKNEYEEELLQNQIARLGKGVRFYYEKIHRGKAGKKLVDNYTSLLNYDLSVIVYNFVDMLSHARTEMEMIRELAYDEAAYRSLTQSWFTHSQLLDLLKLLAQHNVKIVITTDHGSIRVSNPVKVVGDKKTTSNLRFKCGKNLNYNPKEVYDILKPEQAHLPKSNLSSTYIFASSYDYLVYPNNYNYYAKYYKSTFQHGGISMEEMLIPLAVLQPK